MSTPNTGPHTGTDIRKVSILGKESIHCGFHLVSHIVQTVTSTLPSSTYVLVTDTVVAPLHLKKFENEFGLVLEKTPKENRARFISYAIPPGETSKSRQGKADIEDFLLGESCTRDTVLLALGGGVIGDLVGFVAATFMRGIRFVQIPTTLLAMVDSSVGGKTAIDTPRGKNLIGAFWQPEYIFIDPSYLETLPRREFCNGMAEVVKTAAIWDEEEFGRLERGSEEIFSALSSKSSPSLNTLNNTQSLTPSQTLLLHIITTSISIKAHIVTLDERETGLRNLVNFGHTIGHAIEKALTPEVLHGECVSVGMVLEAEVARGFRDVRGGKEGGDGKGVLGEVGVSRIRECLRLYDLPVSLEDPRITSLGKDKLAGLSVSQLLDTMKVDKKNASSSSPSKKVVLLSRIGGTYEEKATSVPDSLIARVLFEGVRVLPGPGEGIPKYHPVVMSTPGSKSISNRALVLAALGKGTCRLKNMLHSDDTKVMMRALVELQGAKFSWEDNGDTLVVEGGGGKLNVPKDGKEIYLGNAGTAARFLTTVCALARSPSSSTFPSPSNPTSTLASPTQTIITGNARMKQRPIGPLVSALRSNGVGITYQENEGSLPLAIQAGGLKGGKIELAASVSSQYVSSILLCAPYAKGEGNGEGGGVELHLVGGQVISQPYIDMTIAMMRSFGISVTRHVSPSGQPLDIYTIPSGSYVNPPTYTIESDASSATYPLAIAAITGSTCTITNIGSSSLQGDARFAKDVLERMGCVVKQTETETTVTGPPRGGLKAIGEVDMETMTDAFLGAAVLAAVAVGDEGVKDGEGRFVTKITGIANQRVKECNRIKAMVDELAKFGIHTTEHPTGLSIYAKPLAALNRGVSVKCYDDHRVAMAFSILGSVVEGTVLEEKRCVEKTWPGWWDDLENKIGLGVEGVEVPKSAHEPTSSPKPPTSTKPTSELPPSTLIIGMRGSGKSYIGALAASSLSSHSHSSSSKPLYSFLDADTLFEQTHNIGVREFVQEKGWPAFRAAETALLKELIKEKGSGYVISLGGGVVESPDAREVLVEYGRRGVVINLVRPISEIVQYLGEETARPAYGEPIEEVFKRREPWFKECSTHEFVNRFSPSGTGQGQGDGAGNGFEREVARFFGHVSGLSPNLAPNLETGNHRSYFLSLTYPDITPALPQIEEISAGADALELRVDLLKEPQSTADDIPSQSYVSSQLSALRSVSSLPIVFTVRTVSQGGSHPDSAQDEAFSLMDLALRTGCEYIDVELSWSLDRIRELVARKGRSKIIASWHDWSGNMKWDSVEVKQKYDLGCELGDIVKIVGKALSPQDNFALRNFVDSKIPGSKPLIAINTSYSGQLSRILNGTFSPITHPLLTTPAAPGQLSFAQIQKALNLMGYLPAKRYVLLGSSIKSSPSPRLHNTAFEVLGLPHTYGLFQTAEVDEKVKELVRSADFGGASVTIPHKIAVIPLLDELTWEAKVVGAVNTIIPTRTETGTTKLVGDNTDWVGIRDTIRATGKLSSISSTSSTPGPVAATGTATAGLVIGAGGTARAAIFALHSLGLSVIYLYNRTRETAEKVAAEFNEAGAFNVKAIDKLGEEGAYPGPVPTVVVSTVPGVATSLTQNENGNSLYLPPTLFGPQGGVAIDLAYRPAETPLLALAKVAGGKWATVRGIDILLEQGYRQFYLWTGRNAPRKEVAKRVWEFYESSG